MAGRNSATFEEFREKIKEASHRFNGANEISEKDQEKHKKMVERTKVYLSPESITLDAYILAGLCFRINDRCNGNIGYEFTTRAKSPASTLKKQERFDKQVSDGKRKSSELYDIIASKLVIERVKEEEELLNTFSPETREKYYERKKNIDLMGSIINFFNNQADIGGFYSEYDKEETLQGKIEALKKSFNEDFGDNIHRYRNNVDIESIQRPDLETESIQIIRELRRENKDRKKDEAYKKIIKFLSAEQTSSKNIEDDQEEYYKYLIVLLGRMRRLEYKECENSYKEIDDALKLEVHTFSDLIEKGFNDNVTLEYLEGLEKWCKKMNAQLSDKLQRQIISELMDDSMYLEFPNQNLSVAMEEKPDHTINVEQKTKSNGYVSDHYTLVQKIGKKLKIKWELQATTRHRAKVASIGTASYGGGRLENNAEKERPVKLMPRYEKNKKYTDTDGNLKKCMVIEGYGRLDSMTEEQFAEWREKLESVTPRYFKTRYNPENDSVEFTFHSMYKNANIYFGETNNRKMRQKIDEGFEIIESEKLLDCTEHKITLTREQYRKFMEGDGLKKLVESIERGYEQTIEEETK